MGLIGVIVKFSLTDLSVDEVNLILAALGKLPLETSLGLWAKLKKQAEDQAKPPAPTT